MVSCTDFLQGYTEYRDGRLNPEEVASMEAHLAGCRRCAHYAWVVDEGVRELRATPPIEPSYDFVQRLQHRIYNLEERRARLQRMELSAAVLVTVAVLLLLVAAASWWDPPQPRLAVVELPPMAAAGPKRAGDVHALFRSGPLLLPAYESTARRHTVFFQYTRLGSTSSAYASYPADPLRPR